MGLNAGDRVGESVGGVGATGLGDRVVGKCVGRDVWPEDGVVGAPVGDVDAGTVLRHAQIARYACVHTVVAVPNGALYHWYVCVPV